MRIGFVSRYPPVHCGIGEYTRFLADAIASLSRKVEVIVFSTTEAGAEPYHVGRIKVVPSFERLGPPFSTLLNKLADEDGVDVLHLQHEYGIFGEGDAIVDTMVEAIRERLAKVAVATLHTVYHPYAVGDRSERLTFMHRAASELDTVVVHSHIQEFELYSQGVDLHKVHRIPHGTFINPYVGHNRFELAESLGIEPSLIRGYVITTPGFIRPDKGLRTLLEAEDRLSKLRSDYTIIVAGEPQGKDSAAEYMWLIEEAESRGRLVLLRRYLNSDELLRLAALADVIVLPYRDRPGKYSVSGILHISMGSMKPIVGTRVPRLIELYQFAPRLTTSPGQADELSKLLNWLIENYDYAVAYMASLYSYAVRTIWLRAARKHLALYTKLLAKRMDAA